MMFFHNAAPLVLSFCENNASRIAVTLW